MDLYNIIFFKYHLSNHIVATIFNYILQLCNITSHRAISHNIILCDIILCDMLIFLSKSLPYWILHQKNAPLFS